MIDIDKNQAYLDDQTAALVNHVQSLVALVRSSPPSVLQPLTKELTSISSVVSTIISAMDNSMASDTSLRNSAGAIVDKLEKCREKVLDAIDAGPEANSVDGREDGEWEQWCQGLPPIAFEIARETKELVKVVDMVGGQEDDFA